MEYTITSDHLTVRVASLGAEVQSIRGADGTECLWQGDPAYWCGRFLIMFPFCGRNPDGRYSVGRQSFSMGTHGFARTSEFSLTEKSASALTLTLCDSAETLAQYPFRFRFSVRFRVNDDALSVCYEVENSDADTMYFGVGGHPAFNIPFEPGKRLEDYRIEFAEPCTPIFIGETDGGFLTGVNTPYPLTKNSVPLTRELLSHPFCLGSIAKSMRLTSGGEKSLRLTYPQMKYLALWQIHKPDTPFVCIEPWSSLPAKDGEPSVWEEKQDLLRLCPGETYRNEWMIAVESDGK